MSQKQVYSVTRVALAFTVFFSHVTDEVRTAEADESYLASVGRVVERADGRVVGRAVGWAVGRAVERSVGREGGQAGSQTTFP